MRKMAWLLIAALAAWPAAAANEGRPAWRSWDPGLQEAQKLQRPILVDVYTKWCGWCKRMDRDVYARDDIRAYLDEKYVSIKLDAEATEAARYENKSFTARTLAARFRVTGYPTTLFLRPNGEHLVNVPGYVEPDQFLILLRYIGDGHLDRGVTWEEFKAKQRP